MPFGELLGKAGRATSSLQVMHWRPLVEMILMMRVVSLYGFLFSNIIWY